MSPVTCGSQSFNSCLYKGPQAKPLLFDILICLKTIGDIVKAFLQIQISGIDPKYLRFLWFDNVFKEFSLIVRYRFARVVFGVTTCLFCSTWQYKNTLRWQLWPCIHNYIFTFFFSFFDDFTGGSNNTQNTFELFKKLKNGFLEGKFNVTKWRTNNK